MSGCETGIRINASQSSDIQDTAVVQRGIPMIAGNTYTASVWVRGHGNFSMCVGCRESGEENGCIGVDAAAGDIWTRYSKTFTAGEDCRISEDGTVDFYLSTGAGDDADITYAGMILESGRGSSQTFRNIFEAVKGSSVYSADEQESVFINTPVRRGGAAFIKQSEKEDGHEETGSLKGAMIGLYNISERDLTVNDSNGDNINAVSYRTQYEEALADQGRQSCIAELFRTNMNPCLTLITDENGWAGTDHDRDGYDESLAPGTYLAAELEAPDGYLINEQWYVIFSIHPDENGYILDVAGQQPDPENADREDFTGVAYVNPGESSVTGLSFDTEGGLLADSFNGLTIRKTDGSSHETLSGVTFEIWTDDAGSDEVIAEDVRGEPVLNHACLITDSRGLIELRKLRSGQNAQGTGRANRIYYIRETKGPAGYLEEHTVITVMVDENGMIHGENESGGTLSLETIKKASEAAADAMNRMEQAGDDTDSEKYRAAQKNLQDATAAIEQLRRLEAALAKGESLAVASDGQGYVRYELEYRNIKFRSAGLFTGGNGRGRIVRMAAGILLLTVSAGALVFLTGMQRAAAGKSGRRRK